MPSEPDAAQGTLFSGFGDTESAKPRRAARRPNNIGSTFNFDIPGLGDVQRQLSGVTSALTELKATLQGMSSTTAGSVVSMLNSIKEAASQASASLNGVTGAVGGFGGSGGGGGGGPRVSHTGNSTSSNAGMALAATSSAAAAVASISGYSAGSASSVGGATTNAMGSSLGGMDPSKALTGLPLIGGILSAGADLAMLPLRFARERIQNNRTQALGMSQELTPYQWSIGGSLGQPQNLMRSLSSQFPGMGGGGPGIQGDVSDILNALTVGRRSGAQYGFGNTNVQGSRSTGFYQGIAQMQQITPGVGAGQAANVLGAQSGNTASQQASAFYTGGAFSMIKMGGGQKNIREWGEGILRFLETQRPGNKRGTKFKYGELLAQNFPGSNVNAWFQTVGISPDMQDYFWSYALGQAATGSEDVFKDMGGEGGALSSNQAWRRMGSQNVLARNEFGLAGRMGGQYATRERSNQWFNQAMGAIVNKLVPALAQGPLAGVQYLPDQVEDFLWNALESSGPAVQGLVGAVAGWGGSAVGLASGAGSGGGFPMQAGPGTGDIGDYGLQGGTSTAGLSLDLRQKTNKMLKANPNLRINSGLRDSYTQQKLKSKGIGQFGSKNNKSPHYAGEAADIGPSSQYGWLQNNAHKFGLQTAASHGEPWHVQRAGTIGQPRVGDIGDWNDWIPGSGLAGELPGMGIVGEVAGFGDDIAGLIGLLKKVFSGVLSAMDAAASVVTAFNPVDILSGGKAGVGNTVSKYMSLLTGGVNAGGGLQGTMKNASGDGVIGYDAGFAGGLPTTIALSNISSQGGSASTAGGPGATSGTLSDIYTRYAGGTPSQSRTADIATAGRIRAALSVAQQAGFTGEELVTFVSLAGRESNFTPTAYNGNRQTGDDSYGMWQINTLGGMWEQMKGPLGLTSKDQLYDPLTNAKAGKFLFDQSKTPFQSWGPYRGDPPLHGGAEQWVAPVYAIAKQEGFIGDPGYGDGGSRMSNFVFQNTWHIEAGNSTGGGNIDVGRMVPLLADKLEAEMKRRLVGSR